MALKLYLVCLLGSFNVFDFKDNLSLILKSCSTVVALLPAFLFKKLKKKERRKTLYIKKQG